MAETIVVVGGGIAGDEAAQMARKQAPDARVVLITEEPHPLYSACVLADYVCNEIPLEQVFLRGTEEYRERGIESITGKAVTGFDPAAHVLHMGDERLPYDKLILATGSRPFVPPLPGAALEGVVPLKTLDDAEKIRRSEGSSAVVVGSGPVGIESALALRELGWEVTMVELMDRLLPRVFDTPIATQCVAHMEKAGVRVLTGEKVLEILGDERVTGVRTDRRTIDAELAVMVVGMRPEVSLAKAAGLEIGPLGGLVVDDSMATSAPDVWACGDCVETEDRLTGKRAPYMLWNNARLQGRVAGSNAAGVASQYGGSVNVTTVGFEGQSGASVGFLATDLPADEVRTVHRDGHDGAITLVLRNGRLVGAQVLGRTERIGALMAHILRGGDLDDILKPPKTAKQMREGWHLRGLRRELAELLRA